jgi:hypothetical protein
MTPLTRQFLQHRFEVENKDGSKEIITSTLCEYGAPTGSTGHSAMAKLVGIPCAVGKSPSVATDGRTKEETNA